MSEQRMVLTGGTILTGNDANGAGDAHAAGRDAMGVRASAIAWEGERILAVGTDEDVLAAAGPDAKVIDLGGLAVVPGFRDAHAHPLMEGIDASKTSLLETKTLREGIRVLTNAASHLDPDETLEALYNHNEWQERRHPTRDDLDRAIPDRPVVLWHASGHAATANSLALAIAGISASTADRPGRMVLERDAHGEPTGVVDGTEAISTFAAVSPEITPARAREAIEHAGLRLFADGVTSINDAEGGSLAPLPLELDAYADGIRRGVFPARVAFMPGLARITRADANPPTPAELTELVPTDLREAIRIEAGKLYADGALTTRSAWLLEEYADQPGWFGAMTGEPGELAERIMRAHRAGWRIGTHAIGDAAIAAVLDAYEAALRAEPRADHRHRIEHAMTMPPALIARMAALQVIAVSQPQFTSWSGDVYYARLGPGRIGTLMPWTELLAAGVPLAFSSDRPVVSGAPLIGIRSALRHRAPSGRALAPATRRPLSVAEALAGWTSWAAWADRDEDATGRLAAGFRADLVILDADPTAMPAEAWEARVPVSIVATVAAGRLVHGELPA